MTKRIILIVLDSVGVGELPDAAAYNDKGANTLGHIFNALGDSFFLPNLAKLGLYKIINTKNRLPEVEVIGCYGKMMAKSPAKDTTAGHWEMSGIILKKPFPVYPHGFPKEIIDNFEKLIGTKVLGNYVISGTEIIKQLGAQHQKTGYPIVYTSADSVFQIAAHEESFGLNRLYEICQIARDLMQGDNSVGRIIARPFVGTEGNYTRTTNRRDYSLAPPETTILDEIKNSQGEVIGVGKIEDIFNGRGITKAIHTKGNLNGMETTLNELNQSSKVQTLIFTNLVDFDMLWGHRRNIEAYANGLKDFDVFLPNFIKALKDDDILIITADHGCDPTYKLHTDHTREYVPLLVYGKKLKRNVDLGVRETLSDISQTVADIFGIPKMKNGDSFKGSISNEK
ncbi:phosphopentomutase [Candidatus Endomicrobiellum devescovinae]|jgi:phosphopentomutase|uniref:phosphopentomutase n=1 Tax=Candidatus Endomicrobiellum devescovinae TaxID=3242322 RepID=UPI0028188404|nr:phosphopentomutase [Endomicrobium sp.]